MLRVFGSCLHSTLQACWVRCMSREGPTVKHGFVKTGPLPGSWMTHVPGKGTGPGFSFRWSSLRLYTGSRSETGRRINSLRRRSVSCTWRSFRIVFYSTSSVVDFLAVHPACAGAVFRAHGAHFASHFTIHRRSLIFSRCIPPAQAQ